MAKSFSATFLLLGLLTSVLPLADSAQAQGVRAIRSIPAVVVTRDRAVLSSEIPGRILSLPPGVGTFFKKGDALVGFDCRYYEVNRDKASHESEATRKKYENSAKLGQMASAAQLTVDLAEIDYRRAQVELRGAELMVERCAIRAPFDGSVVRLYPQVHETIAVGQPVIEIAGLDRIEIEAAVPPSFAVSVSRDTEIILFVEELNLEVPALVSGIAPVIDSVSQLVNLRARIKVANPKILPGMTGVLRVRPQ